MAIFTEEMDQEIADQVATYPYNIRMACEIASLILKDRRMHVSGTQCYARYNYFVKHEYYCFEFNGFINTKNDYGGKKLEAERKVRRRRKGRKS